MNPLAQRGGSQPLRSHDTDDSLRRPDGSLRLHRAEDERQLRQLVRDVEFQNGHLKDRIDQALLLRGSRDFASRDEYMSLVQSVIDHANAGRSQRFAEEQTTLRSLPSSRLDTDDVIQGIRVSKSSTINVRAITYSAPSRLIGTKVDIRIAAETITVTRGSTVVQTMERLVGKQAASVNYRHVIALSLMAFGLTSQKEWRHYLENRELSLSDPMAYAALLKHQFDMQS